MLTYFLKISPDGVQLYVSRPCAQGTAFFVYGQIFKFGLNRID